MSDDKDKTCEIVTSEALGKTFYYCRTHKVEAQSQYYCHRYGSGAYVNIQEVTRAELENLYPRKGHCAECLDGTVQPSWLLYFYLAQLPQFGRCPACARVLESK